MKLVLCHNFYQQPGGEDQVFADETRLLRAAGHDVLTFTVRNSEITGRSGLSVARDTVWNRRTAAELQEMACSHGADIVHFHNTFPLMSPSAYYAARRAGAAVVQTLHNFRLLCPGSLLLRDGKTCRACVNRLIAWPSVLHACYRGSRAASAVTAGMLAAHRFMGTWRKAVDQYITMTEFARGEFVAGGLPAQRVAVKPNFVDPDPGPGAGNGGFALFVGRLSPEKGIATLLEAWSRESRLPRLVILGDGPLADQVAAAARDNPHVLWRGQCSADVVSQTVGEAACLVLPSICFEGFPKVIVEAYARGTPVLASRLGALPDLVQDGTTGRLFEPGNAGDLSEKVLEFFQDPAAQAAMRRQSRRRYEDRYTAHVNYARLMELYQSALARRADVSSPAQLAQLTRGI